MTTNRLIIHYYCNELLNYSFECTNLYLIYNFDFRIDVVVPLLILLVYNYGEFN